MFTNVIIEINLATNLQILFYTRALSAYVVYMYICLQNETSGPSVV